MISAQPGAFAAEAGEPVRLACNEFPPQKMEAAPDGKPGYDVEILRAAFARVGRGVEVTFFPWKRAFEYAKSGKLDGLCSCSRRADRDALFNYSAAMGKVGVGVFLKAAGRSRTVRAIADLKGLTIGVVHAYNLHQEIADTGMTPVIVADDEKGLRMLLADRVDGFFTFRDTGRYILSRIAHAPDVRFVEFRSSPYYACFSKALPGAARLTEAFDDGLGQIRADGTYDRIMTRYLRVVK